MSVALIPSLWHRERSDVRSEAARSSSSSTVCVCVCFELGPHFGDPPSGCGEGHMTLAIPRHCRPTALEQPHKSWCSGWGHPGLCAQQAEEGRAGGIGWEADRLARARGLHRPRFGVGRDLWEAHRCESGPSHVLFDHDGRMRERSPVAGVELWAESFGGGQGNISDRLLMDPWGGVEVWSLSEAFCAVEEGARACWRPAQCLPFRDGGSHHTVCVLASACSGIPSLSLRNVLPSPHAGAPAKPGLADKWRRSTPSSLALAPVGRAAIA